MAPTLTSNPRNNTQQRPYFVHLIIYTITLIKIITVTLDIMIIILKFLLGLIRILIEQVDVCCVNIFCCIKDSDKELKQIYNKYNNTKDLVLTNKINKNITKRY